MTPHVKRRRTLLEKPPGVRIRMYDVGFGDCFLLLIPTLEGERRILIDCGSIANHKKTTDEIVGRIIADVTIAGAKPHIDIVVATHRHRDHISGFADPRWSDVEVGEVWMPWTERPEDPMARRIRHAQTRLAEALHRALLRVEAAPDLLDLTLNARSNEEAMQVLHHGFAGSPLRRFLPERGRRETLVMTDRLPGVFVNVLGPSYDEDAIRDMDPPAGQSYLRIGRDEVGDANPPEPFGQDWVDEKPSACLSPDVEAAVRAVGEGREEVLAAQLDKAVNGTSLMLLFQVGDANLLFPGDAQWGTWKAALEEPDTQRLLDKVNFYKVGHHGSHNATPIDFIERHLSKRKRDDLWAMLSVRPYKRWPGIPRQPLLQRLSELTDQFVRSDGDYTPKGFTRQTDFWIETTIPIRSFPQA